jgi:serine/threonine-protein kinase
MGEVVRAHDVKLDREVAVKLLPAKACGDERARARLVREARAAAKLQHPGIIHVYDVGETDDGGAFLVMELVRGKSLRTVLEGGGAPASVTIRVIVECARALAFAHRAGSVHRDVKPENVMIREDGRAALLDFGIAKSIAADAATLTDEGVVMGTPAYLAPEQARGEELDGRADQFALAVTAYEALAGRTPWRGTSVAAVVAEILRDDPPPVSSVRNDLPRALDAVLARAMQKRAADRYPDLDAFADALQDIAAQLGDAGSKLPSSLARTEAVPSTPHAVAAAPPRPSRVGAIAALAFVALVVSSVVVWMRSKQSPAAQALSASGSSSPAVATAIAVTDLPMPKSSSLEAIAAYRAGMQATRDGDTLAVYTNFKRASELDPTMAMAFARYADMAMAMNRFPEARAAHERAALLRSTLDAHDQAWVDGEDPLFRTAPPDFAEFARRMAAFAQAYPLDAEAQLNAGWGAYLHGEYEVARRHSQHALELDPKFGFARVLIAASYADEGRMQEARDAYVACADAPSSPYACLTVDLSLAAADSRCGDFETLTTRLFGQHPDSSYANLARACIVARQGGPAETLREATRQWAAATTSPVWARHALDTPDLWYGDFAALLARRADQEAVLASGNNAIEVAAVADELVTALHEAGRDREAGAVAANFVARRPLLSSMLSFGSSTIDESAFVLAMARQTGALSAAEWAKTRDNWYSAWSHEAGSPADRSMVWLRLQADGAFARDDAERAASSIPPGVATLDDTEDAALGHLYALLDRWDEAIRRLERVVRTCDALVNIAPRMRARFELARGYETKGNVAGACDQYAWVVSRWGNAKPRSVSAEAAKAKMRALHCPAQ